MLKTCVEHHEIIGGISLQEASVHVDVISHDSGAVSEGCEGHTPDSQALPDQGHWRHSELSWQSSDELQQQHQQHPHLCQSCRLQEDTGKLWDPTFLQTDTAYLSPRWKKDTTKSHSSVELTHVMVRMVPRSLLVTVCCYYQRLCPSLAEGTSPF